MEDANEFSEFLLPILDFSPENRPQALECLQHRWLGVDRKSSPTEITTEEAVETGMSHLQLEMP